MTAAPSITMAIAGNPNSGKTTLFNALTGARHRVGNYPGITVDLMEGAIKHGDDLIKAVDLPGTYSLTAYSEEELVARNFLVEDRPQVVVDVINATSLERNLYLALQFLELGIPVVLALNMMDEVDKQGKRIDAEKLSRLLQVPVVKTVARRGTGSAELVAASVALARARSGAEAWRPLTISYGPDLDPVLDSMVSLIEADRFLTDRYPARWVALKYMEQDTQILQLGKKAGPLSAKLEDMVDQVAHHCLATLAVDPESIVADYRYGYIASVLKEKVVTSSSRTQRVQFSDKLDLVLTNRFFGPLIMLAVFYGVFQMTFSGGELPSRFLAFLFGWLGEQAAAILPDGHLQSMVVSGVIDGVGGVLSFVPLIFIMFLFITFLEDSGYMARMAYMLDRVLRIFGLHGCSVMPFMVSGGIPGGCAVPGVMASRTLRSPKEKIATLMVAPFMVCAAKVPVFLVITGAFFKTGKAEALFWITLGGWAMALLVARLLRSTLIRGNPTPFVMELPPYRLPTMKGMLIHTTERVWQYIKKAGTVILLISILLWAAMTFPGLPATQQAQFDAERAPIVAEIADGRDPEEEALLQERLLEIDNREKTEALKHSAAGRVGLMLVPATNLAGFSWRTNVALIGGVAAKEVIVSTLGTAYSMGEVAPDGGALLSDRLAEDPEWTFLTAISVIIFVLLYAPCVVTVAVIAKESSWRWAVFAVVFNTLFAFGLATAVFQVGSLFVGT